MAWNASRVLLRHTGGTKEYELLFVVARDGRAMLIQRWGKIGARGQFKTTVRDEAAVRTEYNRTMKRKLANSYVEEVSKVEHFKSADKMLEQFGKMLGGASPENLAYVGLVPGAEIPEAPTVTVTVELDPTAEYEAQMADASNAPRTSDHPDFGTW